MQFFHWQGGYYPLWVKQENPHTERLPIAAEDLSRLRALAIQSCLAHVLAHRRPHALEELGWPASARFQLWVSVLGGAQAGANGGHSDHSHTNSVCSGTFYTKAGGNGTASPIVFSDPRGLLLLRQVGSHGR